MRRAKELPFPRSPDHSLVEAFAKKLNRAILAGRALGLIGMTATAQDAWRSIYSALSADRPGLAGALLARSEAQVCSLAALYAVLDVRTAVDPVHLHAPIPSWKQAEQAVGSVFGVCHGTPRAGTSRVAPGEGRLRDTR